LRAENPITNSSGGASWFRSGVPSVNYNGIAGTTVEVDAALARVRDWGLPARWIVSSAGVPESFETKLEERGLNIFDESPGMVTVKSILAVGQSVNDNKDRRQNDQTHPARRVPAREAQGGTESRPTLPLPRVLRAALPV